MTTKKTNSNANTKKKQGWDVTPYRKSGEVNALERVNLNPEAFDRLIQQHGVNVKVYRTLYCPNVKSIDGAEHEIDCELCNGSGWLDTRPIDTIAFIQSQSLNNLAPVEGNHDGNTVYISFLRGIEVQYFTLISLCDHTEIFFERVVRSPTEVDKLKYSAKRVNVLLDSSGIEYFQGTDFKLDCNGNVIWLAGKGPSEETIYSIHYEANIQFRAIRALHTNRFEQVKDSNGELVKVKMPEQWICVKEYLVRRKGYDGNFLDDNPIPDYDEETPE